MRHACAVLLALTLAAARPAAAADWVVVVDAGSKVGPLRAEQLANLWLGKVDELPGAGKVVPLDQAETSALFRAFHERVTRKTLIQQNAYWARLSFTGKGEPPRRLADSAEVKRVLKGNAALIGYVERSQLDASLRVVLELD